MPKLMTTLPHQMRLVKRYRPSLSLPRDGSRSTHLHHVSDLIRPAAKARGAIPDDDTAIEDSPIATLRVLIGQDWERGLAEREWGALDIAWQPGELVLDGVAGTPDGLYPASRLSQVEQVEEVKCTWKDRWRFDEGQEKVWWMWTRQVMSYCWMAGRKVGGVWVPVTRARFWVCFIRAELRGYAPAVETYEFEFGVGELRRHWGWMMKQKEDLERS